MTREMTTHKTKLVHILKDIYGDLSLARLLGFKGGTEALLFYDLPRFSVDLDFDLLNPAEREFVFEKIKSVLEQYGVLRNAEKKGLAFSICSPIPEK